MSLDGLVRTFRQGPRRIEVLKGASAELYAGEAVALVGPSGAGKSSLLHTAGLLEKPDAGAVFINGRDCIKLGDRQRTQVRRTEIGFVYQFHHLLPEFSAIENVALPQMIAGRSKAAARARARELLDGLGLGDRGEHRPAQLSGGEQQRVAIARALANDPKVLLTDEPTGNLDPETAERVFRQLIDLVRGTGVAALIATHNLELAERMDRVLHLSDGLLREQTFSTAA
ncbi:MAG: ABC transporter ATP-binding protein [Hyphomicrobiaceae bacterium]